VTEKTDQKVKGLALIGKEMTGSHGASTTRAAIAEFLWSLPWLEVDITGDWDALRWERIAPYDVVIHYSGNRGTAATAEQLAGIQKFLERGGGYVPLHYTTRNDNPEFLNLVGADFNGHPPFGPFTIRVADPDHPITRGLSTIEIEDECYRSKFPDRSALRVLQTSHHPDPEAKIDGEPSSWVREIGQGRLFYSALGHDHRVWPHPVLRELLTRGIRWAAKLEPVAQSS
jgi:uncharacterized protein